MVLSVSFHSLKWLTSAIGPRADCPLLGMTALNLDAAIIVMREI